MPEPAARRIVILHHVNGSTKVCELTSPRISSQLNPDGGIIVLLQDPEGQEIGYAQFSASGLVALGDVAIDQYQALRRPAGAVDHTIREGDDHA